MNYGDPKSWYDISLAERLVFSSFTSRVDDQFGIKELDRPYGIVIFPKYTVPCDLIKDRKDALWLSKAPERPTIYWDGFSAIGLHEVIYSCFGFLPGETKGKIAVIDHQTKRLVPDTRAPELLALRPRPIRATCWEEYSNHIADLVAWAAFFEKKEANGQWRFRENGGRQTFHLYHDLYTYASSGGGDTTRDSIVYDSHFRGRKFLEQGGRTTRYLQRGAMTDLPLDKSVTAWLTNTTVISEMLSQGPTVDDLLALKEPPASFYQYLLSPTRDPKTGVIKGKREYFRELSQRSMFNHPDKFLELLKRQGPVDRETEARLLAEIAAKKAQNAQKAQNGVTDANGGAGPRVSMKSLFATEPTFEGSRCTFRLGLPVPGGVVTFAAGGTDDRSGDLLDLCCIAQFLTTGSH